MKTVCIRRQTATIFIVIGLLLSGGLPCIAQPLSQVFFPVEGQTSFTLSSTPSGSVYVFRDGILLYSPADYSVTANILTLVTAASPGDVVQVMSGFLGGVGAANMMSLYTGPNSLAPSSYMSSDEANKVVTFTARDANGDGKPASFVCGRITGSGVYTSNCDLTPPQFGFTKLRFLDHTGAEKASLQFNDALGVATLNGFANPWPGANVLHTSYYDSASANGPTTLCSVYNDLAQISYVASTQTAGSVSGSMTITISWSEAMSGTARSFTTPAINLQTANDSVNGSLAVYSSGDITVTATVTGNANRSGVYHAIVKAIY